MMKKCVELERIYAPSDNIVARDIAGEMIIVPLIAGIGDMEEDLFSLNETGKAVWGLLDGKSNLHEIIIALSNEYEASESEIKTDVMGIVQELFKRGIVVKATSDREIRCA